MKLQELLKGIKPTSIIGGVDADITGVDIDSRQVIASSLRLSGKAPVPYSAKTCRKRKPKASPTSRCRPQKMP